jgi:hypothetical protein
VKPQDNTLYLWVAQCFPHQAVAVVFQLTASSSWVTEVVWWDTDPHNVCWFYTCSMQPMHGPS